MSYRGVAALLLVLAVACEDPSGLTTGALQVTVATTGADLDTNGYSLAFDGAPGMAVSVNDVRMLVGLSAGPHSLLLGGIAPNCVVDGDNPRQADVTRGDTVRVRFQLTCAALPPADISGVWDWTEQYVNPVCNDTGSYAFSQSGAAFTGHSDQVGVCYGEFGPVDNTRSDPVTRGVVTDSTLTFVVGAQGQCSYTARISGDPPAHLSGTTTCGAATGTWQAVRGQPVASVTVAPLRDTLLPGSTVQLAIQLRDAAGHRIFRPVTWSSDQPAVATVSDLGKVTAVAVGSATITATAGGKSASAAIVVPAVGVVHVTTTTTGVDLDNGYVVNVDGLGARSVAVAANGAVTISGVAVGEHHVTLGDIANNCAPVDQNQQSITVVAGAAADVAFAVTCAAVADQFAFEGISYADEHTYIYLMRGNAANVLRLTSDAAGAFHPTWSPDGLKIAFESGRDGQIYTMNADGSNVVRVTDGPDAVSWPAWSPDGARIAFVKCLQGNCDVYVMNVDGSNIVRLTDDPASDGQPAWSPDGGKIAFVSNRSGAGTALYVMNADGSGVLQLTSPSAVKQPAWSPDGTKIAYSDGPYGDEQIFVMSIDKSSFTDLTNDAYPARNASPSWSPDGTRIAFVVFADLGCDDSGCYSALDLAVMNADGTGRMDLGVMDPDVQSIAWRPRR